MSTRHSLRCVHHPLRDMQTYQRKCRHFPLFLSCSRPHACVRAYAHAQSHAHAHTHEHISPHLTPSHPSPALVLPFSPRHVPHWKCVPSVNYNFLEYRISGLTEGNSSITLERCAFREVPNTWCHGRPIL